MTLAIAIEKRLESEIARALEIMGHVRDRPEGLNEADTKAVSAIFREPDAALVRIIVKRTQDLQLGEVRDSLRRADLTVRFPVAPRPAGGGG